MAVEAANNQHLKNRIVIKGKGCVKSVFGPSGLLARAFSGFPSIKQSSRSISTPPWIGC